MVLVVRGPPVRRRPIGAPVMTGLLVGGAIARGQQQRRQQAEMQREVARANERAANAQMTAEQARRDAERAKAQNQQTVATTTTEMRSVTVVIPQGVGPGMSFNVSYEGQNYRVTCPQGMGPGQRLTVQLPAPQPAVAIASAAPIETAQPLKSQGSGRDLFRSAMLDDTSSSSVPMALPSFDQELVLVADHKVDENSPQMRQFGIISISRGTRVVLVEGDLINGLGGPYKDYIRVSVPSQGDRQGLISRLVVKPASSSVPAPVGPPPAIQ